MKIVWLHPPLYPLNIDFFDRLGLHCQLTVYVFGDFPKVHRNWKLKRIYQSEGRNFRLRQLGQGHYPRAQIFLPRFLVLIRRDRPDVVLSVAFAPYSWYAACCRKIFSYKFLIYTDANAFSEQKISRSRLWYRRQLLQRVDGAIACSALTSEYLRQLDNRVPIQLSNYAVDVGSWRRRLQELSDQKAIRQQLAIPAEVPLLLGVGRVDDNKKNWQLGFTLLQQQPQLHYLVVGGTDAEGDNLRRQARELNLTKRFHLFPKTDSKQLACYYAIADAFIFPVLAEPFGFVVLEAMAMGLAVFCSCYCGAAGVVTAHNAGMVFDPEKDFISAFKNFWQHRHNFATAALQQMKGQTLENRASEFQQILYSFGQQKVE